jgi:hypothetical protein
LEPETKLDLPEAELEEAPDELFATALFDRRRLTPAEYDQTARLIARWPPDRPLDTSRPEVRDTIRRLASTAIEVVFTERFVRLAKPGGLIAVIVPDSIVASDRLGPFRLWLMGKMELLATVGLPQKIFTGVGANARTSIIFARRRLRDRPDGWCADGEGSSPAEDRRQILLVEPRIEAPGFTPEVYLARVLADARRQRETLWPEGG